jgi:hypothetical protein
VGVCSAADDSHETSLGVGEDFAVAGNNGHPETPGDGDNQAVARIGMECAGKMRRPIAIAAEIGASLVPGPARVLANHVFGSGSHCKAAERPSLGLLGNCIIATLSSTSICWPRTIDGNRQPHPEDQTRA